MHNTQCNNLELVCDLNILGLMFHPSKCPTSFSYRLHFRDSAICVTSFHVLPQLGGGQLFLGHPTHPTSTQCQPISYVYIVQTIHITNVCMYTYNCFRPCHIMPPKLSTMSTNKTGDTFHNQTVFVPTQSCSIIPGP